LLLLEQVASRLGYRARWWHDSRHDHRARLQVFTGGDEFAELAIGEAKTHADLTQFLVRIRRFLVVDPHLARLNPLGNGLEQFVNLVRISIGERRRRCVGRLGVLAATPTAALASAAESALAALTASATPAALTVASTAAAELLLELSHLLGRQICAGVASKATTTAAAALPGVAALILTPVLTEPTGGLTGVCALALTSLVLSLSEPSAP